MKKLKEFLFFPLAIILIIGIFLGLLLIFIPDGAYYSGGEYLKEMVTDEYFFSAMLITFSIPFLVSIGISIISTVIMALLKWKKKINITRCNFYLTLALLSTGASFTYYAIFTNALEKTDQLNVTVQMTFFAIIFSLMVSIFVVFIVWLIEFVASLFIKFIKKNKETKFS